MNFPEGSPVFIPNWRLNGAGDISPSSQPEMGNPPSYLFAEATKTKGAFKLSCNGAEVTSNVAYKRMPQEVAAEELDSIDDMISPNEASILQILFQRFNARQYMTRLGTSCAIWVNPLHGLAENSITIMRSARDLCAKHSPKELRSLRENARKGVGEDAEKLNGFLSNQLAAIYMKADQIFEQLLRDKSSQTVCFQGQSGSGKSNLYRTMLQYFLYKNSTLGRRSETGPESASDIMTMEALGKRRHDLFFLPSHLTLSAIAGLRVQHAFGSVASGSTMEFSGSSKCMSTARVVFVEKVGQLCAEKVIFGLHFLDNTRLKPFKRPNLPANTEGYKMPYEIMLMFMSAMQNDPAKLESYKLKATQVAAYLAESIVESAGVGISDHRNNVVNGPVSAAEMLSEWSRDFAKLKQSLFAIGMTDAEWEEVCRILGVICHTQMINIVGVDNAIISSASKTHLSEVEAQLGIDKDELFKVISKKVERGKLTVIDNKATDARSVCERFSLELYLRLASYLLDFCSNGGASKIRSTGKVVMNLVDAPASNGLFEGIGEENNLEFLNPSTVPYKSFYEFCANYALEKMQVFYIEECFNKEVHKYRSENVVLDVSSISMPSTDRGSTVFISLFENVNPNPPGFIQVLEEAGMSLKPDDKVTTDNILKMKCIDPKSNENLVFATKQKAGTKGFRNFGFVVRHSFGTVHYDGDSFVFVNKSNSLFGDKLIGDELLNSCALSILNKAAAKSGEVLDTLLSTKVPVSLPAEPEKKDGAPAAGGSYGSAGFKAFGAGANTTAKEFALKKEQASTTKLLSVLFPSNDSNYDSATHVAPTPHFMLCIRPNHATSLIGLPAQLPLRMDTNSADAQIRALMLPELGQLSQIKFAEPSRTYQEFFYRYMLVLPLPHHSAEARAFMRANIKVLSIEGVSTQLQSKFKIDSGYALKMIEKLFGYRNKCEENAKDQITPIGPFAPVLGNTILFLPRETEYALEKYRELALAKYSKAITLVQKQLRKIKARKLYLKLRSKVIKVQTHYRMIHTTDFYTKTRARLAYVKSKLMMLVRRSKFRKLKAAVNIVKGFMQHKLVHIRVAHLLYQAQSCQNLARGAIMRKRTNLVLSSINKLQRCAKRFLIERRYLHLVNRSAGYIQSAFRGWSSRNVNLALVTHLRQCKVLRLQAKSASKLQKVVRAHFVKQRKLLVTRSVSVIQRWSKRCKDRFDYLKVLLLTQWLQKECHYVIANNRINKMLERKMIDDVSRLVAIARERELDFTSKRPPNTLCLFSEANSGTLSLKASNVLSMDVNTDISLAYPNGWISSVMGLVDSLNDSVPKKSLAHIAIGSHHTILVDDMSNVYSFGMGDGGQLGHGSSQSFARPRVVEKIRRLISEAERGSAKSSGKDASPSSSMVSNSIGVRSISCGREHTLLLTQGGRVWSWGSNKFGQLGHSNFETCAVPRQVVAGASSEEGGSMHSNGTSAFKQMKQISAGGYHSASLTESGTLYTWGSIIALGRQQGQSGNSQNRLRGFNSVNAYEANKRNQRTAANKNDCEPGTPPFFTSNTRIPIAHVVCGDAHITVKCTSTVRNLRSGVELYAWGNNSYGQLGIGDSAEVVTVPMRVKLPATVIETARPESQASEGGTAKSIGPHKVEAKSLKSAPKSPKSTLLENKDGTVTRLLYSESDMSNAVLVSGGRHMLLCLKGDVWAWGWNQYGQIGDGDSRSVDQEADASVSPNKQNTFTIGGVVVNADGTTGANSRRQKFTDVLVPKRIIAHGSKNVNGDILPHIANVSAGWRYSAASSYLSKAVASSEKKSSSKEHNASCAVYMWGAVPRGASFLRNGGAKINESTINPIEQSADAKTDLLSATSEPKIAQNATATAGVFNTASIKQAKSFVAAWGREMNKDSFASDTESESEDERADASVSTSRVGGTRKSKISQYEDAPISIPTEVSIQPNSFGPVVSVMACNSSALSVNIVITKELHGIINGSQSSLNVSSREKSTLPLAPMHTLSPLTSSPPRSPMAPWHKPDSAMKPINFGLDQTAITNKFKALKQAFVPGAARLTANGLGSKWQDDDKYSVADDAKSVHSHISGMTGDYSVTSRSSRAARKKAERRETLANAKKLELRAREKDMQPNALLLLFAPFSAKAVAKNDSNIAFDINHATSLSAQKHKKKSVFFMGSGDVSEIIAGASAGPAGGSESTSAAKSSALLLSETSVTAEIFISSEIEKAPQKKKNALPTRYLAGGNDSAIEHLQKASTAESERKDTPHFSPSRWNDAYMPSFDERSPAQYSTAAFDYGKHSNPKASPEKRDKGEASPLRLDAVKNLASMIEKIRVVEQDT